MAQDPILRISTELHRELKAEAARAGKTLSRLVDGILWDGLGKRKAETTEAEVEEMVEKPPMTKQEEYVACRGNPTKEAEWYLKYSVEVEPGKLAGPGL